MAGRDASSCLHGITQSPFECFSASDVTNEELIGDRSVGVGSAVRGAGWR